MTENIVGGRGARARRDEHRRLKMDPGGAERGDKTVCAGCLAAKK
jgi:hypothetical protein